MNIYSVFVHIHSGLRWLVLLAMLFSIACAIYNLYSGKNGERKESAFPRIAMFLVHLQLLVGLVLFFISPKVVFEVSSMKDKLLRFFLIEHSVLMLAAIILITVGYVKAKKAATQILANKRILVFYAISLVIILASIPWPFRGFGGGWF